MPETITDYLCTACGCLCDDLTLTVEGRRITQVEPPCPVAASFFLRERPEPPAAALIAGKPATLEAALARAAEILQAAASPLVCGLERATVDVQRAAVALADKLGATLDPTDDAGRSRNHAPIQTLGAVAATLGEVAGRSDLIVYWNCDPATTHPRHIERIARHSYTTPGEHLAKRRVVVVSATRNATSKQADEALTLRMGSDLAALTVVRAILAETPLGDEATIERQTGAPLAQWAYLAQRMRAAKYTAIFYDPTQLTAGDRAEGWQPAGENAASKPTDASADGPDAVVQSITELVREHHRHSRAVALPLGAPGNAAGAAQVLTWQTGFPSAVNFAAGHPRHLPGEATAASMLERGEADAAIIVGANPTAHFTPATQATLSKIPVVLLTDQPGGATEQAAVTIFTPTFGIETPGDVFRCDNIALPLTAAIPPNRPAAEELLQRLLSLLS